MSKANELLEEMSTLYESMSAQTMLDKLESAFRKQFKDAYYVGKVMRVVGEDLIALRFGIQNPKEHSNGIRENDRGYHGVSIMGIKQPERTGPQAVRGTAMDAGDLMLADKLTVNGRGHRILLNPAPDSRMAFDSVKTGWRNKTGTPDQVVKHFTNYFAKLKKLADEHKHLLTK